jgi:hypothetical protein
VSNESKAKNTIKALGAVGAGTKINFQRLPLEVQERIEKYPKIYCGPLEQFIRKASIEGEEIGEVSDQDLAERLFGLAVLAGQLTERFFPDEFSAFENITERAMNERGATCTPTALN